MEDHEYCELLVHGCFGCNTVICAPFVCRSCCLYVVMAVVIRLQGLRNTAGTEDIREFFTGLRIPHGGVHIIGGELDEAFIIFRADDDARRALSRSGGCIKGSPVYLCLSSESEMQKILEENTRFTADNRRYHEDSGRREMLEGRQSFKKNMDEDKWLRHDNETGNGHSRNTFRTERDRSQSCESLFVYLSGMPFVARKEEVYDFFDGLLVNDVILFKKNGEYTGCGLVQFETPEDAREALKRNHKYMGHRYVRVLPSSKNQWIRSGGSAEPDSRQQRCEFGRSRSRSPNRNRSQSPSGKEFCVLYENIACSLRKSHIKSLLHPVMLMDEQIKIFVEDDKSSSQSAIVTFKNLPDYCSGLTHDKEKLLDRVLRVSPISKEKAAAKLESFHYRNEESRSSSRATEGSKKRFSDSERRVLYVRNLPFDVRKVEIIDFFFGFQLSEDMITLLHDGSGAGLGEALVVFKTEKDATMAEALNGQRFLGSKVMLKCITWAQMQKFGVSVPDGGKSNIVLNDVLDLTNDQMYPDIPASPGNNGPSHQFQNPDFRGQRPHGSNQHYESNDFHGSGPTCVQLLNLPPEISVDEIYDFCYGYRFISGSVSLQFRSSGATAGTATVEFENYSEALTAVQELNGRPIGTRRVTVKFL